MGAAQMLFSSVLFTSIYFHLSPFILHLFSIFDRKDPLADPFLTRASLALHHSGITQESLRNHLGITLASLKLTALTVQPPK